MSDRHCTALGSTHAVRAGRGMAGSGGSAPGRGGGGARDAMDIAVQVLERSDGRPAPAPTHHGLGAARPGAGHHGWAQRGSPRDPGRREPMKIDVLQDLHAKENNLILTLRFLGEVRLRARGVPRAITCGGTLRSGRIARSASRPSRRRNQRSPRGWRRGWPTTCLGSTWRRLNSLWPERSSPSPRRPIVTRPCSNSVLPATWKPSGRCAGPTRLSISESPQFVLSA